MRRHALLACMTVALASSVALPGVARADDAAVAEAKARFQEGLELADGGKHEAARLKFQQAYAVFNAPAVLYNLARAEQLTGRELEALEHFRLFLRVSATDAKITDAMRDKAKQNAAELARRVGQIEFEVPSSARLTLDGKPLDAVTGPREPLAVQPGKHTIEATFDGKLKSLTVECAAGATVKAKIEFETGGAVEPPGEHRETYGSGRVVVPIILGVAGLAGIGLGAGFAMSSNSAKTDSESIRRDNPGLCATPEGPQCRTYDAKRSDAESASTISTVGYVAGGVLLAGAVATFVLWPKSREKTSVAPRGIRAEGVRPLIGGGTFGAGLEGRF